MEYFLQATKDFSFTLDGSSSAPILSIYSDSNYSGDNETRRSTTGVTAFVFGSLFYWGSKRIKSITHSAHESEYIALDKGAC